MRVLLVHNAYLQAGGEDVVFAREGALLRSAGHEVIEYTEDNRRIAAVSRLGLVMDTVWSRSSHRRLTEVLRDHRPDVCHFHNTFPLISPAAYHACRSLAVPVVQTLHNYRLLCPASTLLRDGRVCEDCVGKRVAWPATIHACYRESRAASAVATTMLTAHHMLGTWSNAVDTYIALTDFARRKFVEGGLPHEKIVVKPNFMAPDPGAGDHRGGYALFVGRLAPEKGVATLLRAWESLGGRIPLVVAGTGPLEHLLQPAPPGVRWVGQQSAQQIADLMKDAAFLVFPSEWYETFGLTIIEAFSTALPVLAGDLGAPGELVTEWRTGLLFRAGDAGDLREKVEWAVRNPEALRKMGNNARAEFEEKYTDEANYELLMQIYAPLVTGARNRQDDLQHLGA